MVNALDELRAKIDTKERELLQKAEEQAAEHVDEIDKSIRLVKGRSNNLIYAIE